MGTVQMWEREMQSDFLFSFHCCTDAKSQSLISYYGRWTVSFITGCKTKDTSPKHGATFQCGSTVP